MAGRTVTARRRGSRRSGGALRRELGLLATASISIGVMAPTLAMSLTGVEPARLLGRAAPLAFVFAALGVGLVAYGFVRLSGAFASAGSVYAFVGRTLGPRAGFVTGWMLLGTYLIFPAVSVAAFTVFGLAFLDSTGIASSPPWAPVAAVGWALMWIIASREVRVAARSLLAFEAVSVLLILAFMAIVVVKLATGEAPRGRDLNLDWLEVPPGVGLSTIALAATFGFLSFAGFESAGSFGEESRRPTSAIPRSIVGAVVFGGVFYVACMIVQTLGFGTDPAGTRAFADSAAPLAELGAAYVGSGMADVLSAAAMISAVGAGLGCASVAARMLYALGRDAALPGALSEVSDRTRSPVVGLAFVMLLDGAILTIFAVAGTPPINVFFYVATIGVLSLLVMYALTNVAAFRFLLAGGHRAEALLPVLGVGIAGYVLYRNVWPVPASPFNAFPYVVAGWLLAGTLLAGVRRPAGLGAAAPDAS